MDLITHALASYTLKRAAFPAAQRAATIGIIAAGTLADMDHLSAFFGPSAYLALYRTYLHSLVAVALLTLLLTLAPVLWIFLRNRNPADSGVVIPLQWPAYCFAAALLHLLMDLCQTEGVELLWPFSSRRFALDWTAHLDLWIAAILLAAILVPKLSSLVTEEIGGKSKGPRGKVGATVAIVAVVLYAALRALLHGNALATVESRSYRGESPRRAAALPDNISLFHWYGIVETERALHELDLNVGPFSSFDPESARTSYKPEPSIALDAARDTSSARRFLAATRFPKAAMERTESGLRITLRSYVNPSGNRTARQVQAAVDTDSAGKVLSDRIEWDPASPATWWP